MQLVGNGNKIFFKKKENFKSNKRSSCGIVSSGIRMTTHTFLIMSKCCYSETKRNANPRRKHIHENNLLDSLWLFAAIRVIKDKVK